MNTVNNNVNPIRDPQSALDRLFHKMTWVPEILLHQADYDREVELFGAAWQEVQDLRHEIAELKAGQEQAALPALGDEDATVAIADDGADFLAAISALDEINKECRYLDWYMFRVAENVFYSSRSAGEFTLKASTALALVTAIYTLETNGVTEPAEEEQS